MIGLVGWLLGGLFGIIGFYGSWLMTGKSLWSPLLHYRLNGGLVGWLIDGWLVAWSVGGWVGWLV